MTRIEIARKAYANGTLEQDVCSQLASMNFSDEIIEKAVERGWITRTFADALLEAENKKNRYEVKKIEENWFGIWDNKTEEFLFESTEHGIKAYAKMFNIEDDREGTK